MRIHSKWWEEQQLKAKIQFAHIKVNCVVQYIVKKRRNGINKLNIDRKGIVVRLNKKNFEKCYVRWDGNTSLSEEYKEWLMVVGCRKKKKINENDLLKIMIKHFGEGSREAKLYTDLLKEKNHYKRKMLALSNKLNEML